MLNVFISTSNIKLYWPLSTVLLASDLQRVEWAPPEVSGLVEKERFPRGVEECYH